MELNCCCLCPRNCKADRRTASGYCGAGLLPKVAKVMLHRWEEPCICYGNGCGAVFFSACPLQCVFCQNHEISTQNIGEETDAEGLFRIFLSLEEQGACNLELVSPTPHLLTVIPALRRAKERGLSLPVIYNCGGYESVESIHALAGLVDVFLPDAKFFSPKLAKAYANAEDYPEVSFRALEAMLQVAGPPQWEQDRLLRGVMVRHLVLPGSKNDSLLLLERLAEIFGKDGAVFSLMRQYTPMHQAKNLPPLHRRLTELEYQRAVEKASQLSLKYCYTQSKESVGTKYVPDFSCTGIDK